MADHQGSAGSGSSTDPAVVERTVPAGSDERAGAVWRVKERIRRLEGLLDQRRAFFDATYRQSRCHLAEAVGGPPAGTSGDGSRGPVAVVGFAVVRPDGYLSLLGVAPGHRGRGLGSRLLDRVVADHPEVGCHVRATNERALDFYLGQGFVVDGTERGYYRDGTDAYRLVRAPGRADGVADALE